MSSPEIEFLEKVYELSECGKSDCDDASRLILRSFTTMLTKGENNLDLARVLENIDHDRISNSEKIAFLMVSLECNNSKVYHTQARADFCTKIRNYLERTHDPKTARSLMQGLE